MKKNKTNKWQLIICCLVAAIFIATIFVLFCVKILPLVAFLVLLLVILLLLSGYVVGVKIAQIRAIKIAAKKEQDLKDYREKKMKELYELLGVELVFNEDGTIKDIFELIGIPKRFDKDGRRIKTIYEELKINPRITPDGVELPNVFIIKNRVKKVARGIAEPLVLTAKPIEKKSEKGAGEESKTDGAGAKAAGAKDGNGASKTAAKPASKGDKKKVGSTTFITPAKSGKKAKTDKLSTQKIEIKKLETDGKPTAFKANSSKSAISHKELKISEKKDATAGVNLSALDTKTAKAQVDIKTEKTAAATLTAATPSQGVSEPNALNMAPAKPAHNIAIKAQFYGKTFLSKGSFRQKHICYFEIKTTVGEAEVELNK